MRSSDTTIQMSMSGSPIYSNVADEEDLRELGLEGQVEFLSGAFFRLHKEQGVANAAIAAVEVKTSSIDGKMSSMESAITNLASSVQAVLKSVGKMPVHEIEQQSGSSQPSSQVRTPVVERSFNTHSRSGDLNLANRESMLKKVEMPVCDGTKVLDWIMDLYFYNLGRYSDEAKLDLVPLCLQGAVKKWFAWVMRMGGFQSWRDFKQRLMVRFSDSIDEEPETRVFAIKQTGSVTDYVSEFEELSAQVPGIADHHLERIFYNGLSLEMKEVIRMKDPQGLQNFIAAVLRMETSAFCKVVGDATATSQYHNKGVAFHSNRNHGNPQQYRVGQERTKPGFIDTKQLKENVNPQRSSQRPRMKYSDAELDGMRRDGVCFKCGDKWSKIHAAICPKRELRILTMVNGLEMEVMEHDEEVEMLEVVTEQRGLKTLSYNAFMGISSPRTIKLLGMIGQKSVTILLDSGASHNFISPDVVKGLKLMVCEDKSLDVLLGNGVVVKGIGVCQGVEFQINSTIFTSNFIALELGSVDVVLGIQWLETLGKCEVDWKEQEFSFLYGGKRVTLWGGGIVAYMTCRRL